MDRNKKIYFERVEKKRTLQSIADKYNISRERVRQIVKNVEEVNSWQSKLPEVPVIMRDIPWSKRAFHCLVNEGWADLTLEEFVTLCNERKHPDNMFRLIPNFGVITYKEVKDKLSKYGYQISDAPRYFFRTEEFYKEYGKRRAAREARNDEIVQHYLDIRRCDWIAEKVGVSKATVCLVLTKRLGPLRKRRLLRAKINNGE